MCHLWLFVVVAVVVVDDVFLVLIQLSIEWQLGCYPIGAVVNRAAVDIWMRMSFEIRVLDFFR